MGLQVLTVALDAGAHHLALHRKSALAEDRLQAARVEEADEGVAGVGLVVLELQIAAAHAELAFEGAEERAAATVHFHGDLVAGVRVGLRLVDLHPATAETIADPFQQALVLHGGESLGRHGLGHRAEVEQTVLGLEDLVHQVLAALLVGAADEAREEAFRLAGQLGRQRLLPLLDAELGSVISVFLRVGDLGQSADRHDEPLRDLTTKTNRPQSVADDTLKGAWLLVHQELPGGIAGGQEAVNLRVENPVSSLHFTLLDNNLPPADSCHLDGISPLDGPNTVDGSHGEKFTFDGAHV